MNDTTTYPKFFVDLVGEINACDESAFTPKWPVKPEEKVIPGELSTFCRKLFALAQFYRRDVDTMTIECRYTPCEQHEELHWKIGCARAKVDLLDSALWAIVREDRQLWSGYEGLGIRQDWTIVMFKIKNPLPPGIKFLGLPNLGEDGE